MVANVTLGRTFEKSGYCPDSPDKLDIFRKVLETQALNLRHFKNLLNDLNYFKYILYCYNNLFIQRNFNDVEKTYCEGNVRGSICDGLHGHPCDVLFKILQENVRSVFLFLLAIHDIIMNIVSTVLIFIFQNSLTLKPGLETTWKGTTKLCYLSYLIIG